jgi:hypothetical protein
MNFKAFGCSFIYGSELQLIGKNNIGDSLLHASWPALIAEHYGVEFENHAWPGAGNLRVLEQILTQAELADCDFFIINWSWIDRYDFIEPSNDRWATLRPNEDTELHKTYYKNFYNQYHSMLTNSSYISTAINILNSKNIPFCMTLMDNTLFDPIDPGWQDPYALRILQKSIKPYITWFDNMDFLSWSQKNNFPISQSLHPLESAHQAAADYMIKLFDKQNIIALTQPVLF